MTTWIGARPEAVFDLARSVDAHRDSMAKSGERAVRGVTEGLIGLGEEVTWQARHFGVTFEMTSRITGYDRPHMFVDEQVDGPFKTWWHQHTFSSEAKGTLMIDTIRYRPPMGVFGSIVDGLILRRYMTGLIAARNQFIKETLEG